MAAAMAAVAVVDDGSDEGPCWQPRIGPETLEEAAALLPGRLFYHETRFTLEQFKYLCEQIGVPELFPTENQRQPNHT